MKYTKFAVLGAGVIGLIAFFLPLIHVKQGGFEGKASAFQFIRGLGQVEDAAGNARTVAVQYGEDAANAADGVREGASAAKYLFYAPFVPCVFFVLFGGLGLLKRYGRLLGVGTFLFGLIGLGIYFLVKAGAEAANKELGTGDVLGSAVTVLLISYVVGTLGGLVALIKPEPKVAPAAPAMPPVAPPQQMMPSQ